MVGKRLCWGVYILPLPHEDLLFASPSALGIATIIGLELKLLFEFINKLWPNYNLLTTRTTAPCCSVHGNDPMSTTTASYISYLVNMLEISSQYSVSLICRSSSLYVCNKLPFASAANILLKPWWAIASIDALDVPWKSRFKRTLPQYFLFKTSKKAQCFEYSLKFWIRSNLTIIHLFPYIVSLNSLTAHSYSSVPLGTVNKWHAFSAPFSNGRGCQNFGKAAKWNRITLLCLHSI